MGRGEIKWKQANEGIKLKL